MTGRVRISVAAWVATILGALVLTPVFSGPFLFASAFMCAAITGIGILLQNLRAPRFLIPIVQLAVLVGLVGFLFLRDTLHFGLLPGRETVVQFNQQMVNAMDAINRYSAPLPPGEHLTMFASTVIAATGLLIHLVAVQLRQAAWAGLLLLTMYTVPAATVHGGLPALLFVPPAVGYIVLLAAEGRSRLSRWGRRISGVSHLDAAQPVEASALGQAGRRIGLSVIVLASLLPALLPTLPEGVLGNGLAGSGPGTGIGASVSSANPMLDMGKNLKRGDNVVALTYRGGPSGGTYLRLTALDLFDGRVWGIAPREEGRRIDGPLTLPPGYTGDLASADRHQLDVSVSRSFRSPFAPVPYPLTTISLKRNWRYDAGVLDVVSANGQVIGGQDYKLTYYDLKPTPSDLASSIRGTEPDAFTSRLPRQVPEELRELAREVTKSAGSNQFRQAVALQDWFRSSEFTYSTSTDSQSGMPALKDFLLESKQGYCEQFATGMALLSRILGIPSRVAVGFLPGTAGKDGEYTVRMHDMHAWPELYFDGLGWIRFEPTPSARVATPPSWTNAPSVDPATPTPTPTAAPTTPGSAEESPDRPRNQRDEPTDAGVPIVDTGNWFSNGGWKVIGTGLLVVLLLWVPWLIRSLTRRRRFAGPPGRAGVEGLWAEIRDTTRDVGLDWSDVSTPRQTGDWLVSKLPDEAHADVVRLARGVEAVRYAGLREPELDLRSEAAVVQRALWQTATRLQRWRARLLPPSWRWYLNRGSAEASDLLDEFDLLLARLRARLLPRTGRHHAR